jgi:hypothetical protein
MNFKNLIHSFSFLLFFVCLGSGTILKAQGSKVVSGTVLLTETKQPDYSALLKALKSDWSIQVDSSNINDKTLIFKTRQTTVMVAYLDYQASKDVVQTASAISWLWKTALQETAAHQAQMVVSVIGSEGRTLELYQLFTKVAAAALQTSNSIGVLMPDQLLVLSKGYYLTAAQNMSDENPPLYCWIFFGLVDENGKTGSFTYGLKEFGLLEMEVANSSRPLFDVQNLLYDAAKHVLRYNLKIRNGQKLPLAEGFSLETKIANAVYLEGEQSVQLTY